MPYPFLIALNLAVAAFVSTSASGHDDGKWPTLAAGEPRLRGVSYGLPESAPSPDPIAPGRAQTYLQAWSNAAWAWLAGEAAEIEGSEVEGSEDS